MTLVEVLVALAIVFVIFLGLSDAGIVVLNENIKNSMRDEAVSVAEVQVQEARRTSFAGLADKAAFHVFRPIRGLTADYTVTWAVANPDGSTPPSDPNHRQVTINVSWSRHQKAYNHQVVTIVRQR